MPPSVSPRVAIKSLTCQIMHKRINQKLGEKMKTKKAKEKEKKKRGKKIEQ